MYRIVRTFECNRLELCVFFPEHLWSLEIDDTDDILSLNEFRHDGWLKRVHIKHCLQTANSACKIDLWQSSAFDLEHTETMCGFSLKYEFFE